MGQVAVGAVDLDRLEAGRQRALGGGREGPDDAVDLVHRQFERLGVRVERHGGRPARLPAGPARRDGRTGRDGAAAEPRPVGRCLAPGMTELDRGHRAELLDQGGDPGQALLLALVPQAEVVRGDPALGADGRRLDDHHSDAAGGPGGEVGEVEVGGHTGLGAVRLRRVGAHRGHPDPVGHGQRAKGDRLEQGTHGCSSQASGVGSRALCTPVTVLREMTNYETHRTMGP